MVERKEQEHLLRQAARGQLLRGEIDRRQFMTRSIAAGLGLAGASVAAKLRQRICVRAGAAPHADLLSVDRGPAPLDSPGQRAVP